MAFCTECDEAVDRQDLCRTCHCCERCCDCDEDCCDCDDVGSFTPAEMGEEPEDEWERRTR